MTCSVCIMFLLENCSAAAVVSVMLFRWYTVLIQIRIQLILRSCCKFKGKKQEFYFCSLQSVNILSHLQHTHTVKVISCISFVQGVSFSWSKRFGDISILPWSSACGKDSVFMLKKNNFWFYWNCFDFIQMLRLFECLILKVNHWCVCVCVFQVIFLWFSLLLYRLLYNENGIFVPVIWKKIRMHPHLFLHIF